MPGYEEFEEMFGGYSAFQEQGYPVRDYYAPQIIYAIYKRRKPAGSTRALTESAQRTVEDLGLEAQTIVRTDSNTPGTVIARKGTANEILREADRFFEDYVFYDRLVALVEETKGMTIRNAVIYLFTHPMYLREPAIDACLGLLFGYPVCCIRYYIETTHLGVPRDPNQEFDKRYERWASTGRTLCRNCRKRWLTAMRRIAKMLEEELSLFINEFGW